MQPHIGRWHCRYRVSQEQPEAAVAASRVERAVRPRVLDAYAEAVALTDAGDPTVYVVREVRLDLTLVGSARHSEIALARRWGERACAAVVRRIVAHGDDPAEVARFADTPDYIASFIADLLRDVAWDRWYYGAFAKLRRTPVREAILALLGEHREHVAAILQALARRGCLRAVLDLLGGEGARALWAEAVQHPPPAEPEAEVRVFARAAFRLIDTLGLWAAAAPPDSDVFAAALVRHSLAPEWTDRRSLAFALFAVLRAADREGLLARPRTGALPLWHARRLEILAELDWLDVEWIGGALDEWLADDEAEAAVVALPARRAVASPSQRLILERLAALLRAGAIRLDHRAPAGEENALRLYAALASMDGTLAAHGATPSLIRLLLSCLRWLLTFDQPGIAIEAIRSGTIERALGGIEAEAHHPLRAAAAIGAPAADVLERLVPATRAPAIDESLRIETGCAGLFLLVRALTDTRFVQMVDAVHLQLSPVLLALGIQWGGAPAWREGRLDLGLALWAGVAPDSEPLDSLRALESGGCEALCERVVGLLRDRQALDRAVEIVEVPPESWASDLAIAWPAAIALPSALVGMAVHLLKLWARWLPGIGSSTVPYLLANLIRRRGVIQVGVQTLDVALDPAPLDVVMDMAGYLGSVPVPWLEERRLTLRIERTQP